MGSEKIGIFASVLGAVRNRFFDNFNRANQTGLGTATDGSSWRQIRGQFNISGNQAVGADNNYPMAVVDMPFSNVDIDLFGITQGSAAALWVTDSGNWWAVGIDQTSVTNCQTCVDCIGTNSSFCNSFTPGYTNCIQTGTNSATCNAAGNQFGGNCQSTFAFQFGGNCQNTFLTWNAGSCSSWNTPGSTCISWTRSGGNCSAWNSGANAAFRNCRAWNAVNFPCGAFTPVPGNCKAWTGNNSKCNTWNAIQYNCNTFNPVQWNCAAWTPGNTFCVVPGNFVPGFCSGNFNSVNCNQWSSPYSCNCVTTYPQYIRIMKSVSSVVSEVWSTTVGSVVQSLRVLTSGSQITVKAYSDPNLTTQIGSDIVHTPTGVTVTSTFGITIDPSSYNQGYSIDAVEITKN